MILTYIQAYYNWTEFHSNSETFKGIAAVSTFLAPLHGVRYPLKPKLTESGTEGLITSKFLGLEKPR